MLSRGCSEKSGPEVGVAWIGKGGSLAWEGRGRRGQRVDHPVLS